MFPRDEFSPICIVKDGRVVLCSIIQEISSHERANYIEQAYCDDIVAFMLMNLRVIPYMRGIAHPHQQYPPQRTADSTIIRCYSSICNNLRSAGDCAAALKFVQELAAEAAQGFPRVNGPSETGIDHTA
jgi:hypothetical protein